MSPEQEPQSTSSTESPGILRDQGLLPGEKRSPVGYRLAWSLCAVSLILLALAPLLAFLGRSTPLPQGFGTWQEQIIYAIGGSFGRTCPGRAHCHATPGSLRDVGWLFEHSVPDQHRR